MHSVLLSLCRQKAASSLRFGVKSSNFALRNSLSNSISHASNPDWFMRSCALIGGITCAGAWMYYNRVFAADETKVAAVDTTPCTDPSCHCGDASSHPCTQKQEFVPGCHELKIVSGNSNRPLAEKIAKSLKTQILKSEVGKFNDGEICIQFAESVRGKDLFVIQSLSPPTSDNLMELIFMISALRRASAKRVTSVIPFFSYRINRQKVSGLERGTNYVFSSVSEIAKMLEVVGVDNVILLDMEARTDVAMYDGAIFSNRIPVEVLDTSGVVFNYLKYKINPDRKTIVLTPHPKDLPRALAVKQMITQFFPRAEVEAIEGHYLTRSNISSDRENSVTLSPNAQNKIVNAEKIRDCDVLIVDFAVGSGNTMVNWANSLKSAGANRVIGLVSHGLLLNQAPEKIQIGDLEELILLDTVQVDQSKLDRCNKITVLSVSEIIAKAIKGIHFIDKQRYAS